MRLLQVDAFTDQPFRGNPAAVCLLDREVDDGWMQAVAEEMNLSETAFVGQRSDRNGGSADLPLRWFTPRAEVDLCGHATLASAHALWREGDVPADAELRFATRSGVLTASQVDGGIQLDFPATPAEPAEAPPGLLEALGAKAVQVGRSRFDYLVAVGSQEEVTELEPDSRRLLGVAARGVIVTAAARPPFDFVSRFFAPSVGVDEDPVTGSAHCCLSPYWAERLGRPDLVGFQASRRGGVVRTRLAGDRVLLIGQAVTVLRGELC
jgi:PhzF family phenazine biosynthesis protein